MDQILLSLQKYFPAFNVNTKSLANIFRKGPYILVYYITNL